MPRPTSKGPRFIYREAGIGAEAIRVVAMIIGPFSVENADRVQRRVNVWRLLGEAGVGLVAETSEGLEDPPGVFRAKASAWLRTTGEPSGFTLEVELNEWDAWAHAGQTGDQRWLEVPRRQMYAERDRRTAELGAMLDRIMLREVPVGGVPAMLSGLTPDQVRSLAERHAQPSSTS